MDLSEQDLHSIYSWIDDIPLSRPKRNFTRDFSDGVLMAEVLAYYFPKLVQLHNYSPANNANDKVYNWETLNRKVLKPLGMDIPKDHLDAIVHCAPRAVESLLKVAREHILHRQVMKSSRRPRVVTPEFTYGAGDEDANNRLSSRIPKSKGRTQAPSLIPRAPSRLSETPPPEARHSRRPKSSFEVSSTNEKDLMIKELGETNELLLAKIDKLEQLLNLKDRKIASLMSRLRLSNNIDSSSPSP